MDWQQFVMNLESLNPASVEEILVRHGAQSVTFSDAGDLPVLEPAPGETPLWSHTRVTGLFDADADIAKLIEDLKASLALDELPEHSLETLADREWEREWLRDFRAMRFGARLWICPADSTPDQADAVVVRLDPGLAFGTGTHATTAMCLEWLDGHPPAGRHVIDYGCGSGILAIAACKLGASDVTAVDIDPQAIQATQENARRNAVSLQAMLPGEFDAAAADLLLANILANPLIELAGILKGLVKPGGCIVMTGILAEQAEAVMAAYRDSFVFDESVVRDEWVLLVGRRSPEVS
jgi:ribosomal protein L11 methyltransferase